MGDIIDLPLFDKRIIHGLPHPRTSKMFAIGSGVTSDGGNLGIGTSNLSQPGLQTVCRIGRFAFWVGWNLGVGLGLCGGKGTRLCANKAER